MLCTVYHLLKHCARTCLCYSTHTAAWAIMCGSIIFHFSFFRSFITTIIKINFCVAFMWLLSLSHWYCCCCSRLLSDEQRGVCVLYIKLCLLFIMYHSLVYYKSLTYQCCATGTRALMDGDFYRLQPYPSMSYCVIRLLWGAGLWWFDSHLMCVVDLNNSL